VQSAVVARFRAHIIKIHKRNAKDAKENVREALRLEAMPAVAIGLLIGSRFKKGGAKQHFLIRAVFTNIVPGTCSLARRAAVRSVRYENWRPLRSALPWTS
jgi:hypothetical protein